jgi:hypothetical protein
VASTFFLWHLSHYCERAVSTVLLTSPEEQRTSMWLVAALNRMGFGNDPVGRWALALAILRMQVGGVLVRTESPEGAMFRLHPKFRPMWQRLVE